jgi:hypothetical protein
VNEEDWRFAIETAQNLHWKDRLAIESLPAAVGQ